jgi:hypothetical protein
MEPFFLTSNNFGVLDTLIKARGVTDGEPVRASVANRLPGALEVNLEYLHELLKRGFDNSATFLYDLPVSDETRIGDFVYFDPNERIFKPGLAQFLVRNNEWTCAETAYIWGVVTEIRLNRADICTKGLCKFKSSATEHYCAKYQDTMPAGVYYLHTSIPGGVMPAGTKPSVCLGYLLGVHTDGEVQFYLDSSLSPNVRGHEHRSIELEIAPAGTWTPDTPLSLSSINTDLSGWLPAEHSIFEGKAPVNAVWGYNPKHLPQCGWTPAFANRASLSWQRQYDEYADPLHARVPEEFYWIDRTTIWWMTDKPQYFPWDYHRAYIPNDPADVSYGFKPELWLDVIDTDSGMTDSVISSLRAAPESGLTISQYPYGGKASTGDLLLDLLLKWKELTKSDTDGFAVKKIDERNLTLGPVVSGLRFDSSLLALQGEQDANGFYIGRVTMGDASGLTLAELPFESVHLGNVEEAVEREIIGLAFPSQTASFLTGRIVVPARKIFTQYKLYLLFGILLPRIGNIGAETLTLSYRKLRHPSEHNQVIEAFEPQEMSDVPLNVSASNTVAAGGYFITKSEAIDAQPGDIFFIRIKRQGPDGYNDRVILVRKSGLLELPSNSEQTESGQTDAACPCPPQTDWVVV